MGSHCLQAQTRLLNKERHLKCRGTVKVAINALVFGPDSEPYDTNVDLKKVARLKRIFKLEGCDRLHHKHYLCGEIHPDVLQQALSQSNLTDEDLRSKEEPRMLYLPQRATIRCAYGKSRVKAFEEYSKSDRWWTVELYFDLSQKGFSILTEEFENEGSFSDGHICAMICSARLNSTAEKRWWERLSKSKAGILKRLLKHELLAPAVRKVILQIPGIRAGFEIGTWHKIIGAKCTEEVVHYLDHTYQTWIDIMGSKAALQLVDTTSVQSLELRAPGASELDDHYVSNAVLKGEIFTSLTNELGRIQIVQRLRQVQQLIPSMHTLQKDFKYLRLCTDTMKRLLVGKSQLPCTAQTIALDFLQRQRLAPNLVELTGENPLMEDNDDTLQPLLYNQRAWFALANQAQELGFESDEISRLTATDPDREVALRALRDARPSSEFEYDSSTLGSLITSVAQAFQTARRRSSQLPKPALTTKGTGEQLSRRCGRQYSRAYARDRQLLTPEVLKCAVSKDNDITSLFVRRSVFIAFWGPLEEEIMTDAPHNPPEPSTPEEGLAEHEKDMEGLQYTNSSDDQQFQSPRVPENSLLQGRMATENEPPESTALQLVHSDARPSSAMTHFIPPRLVEQDNQESDIRSLDAPMQDAPHDDGNSIVILIQGPWSWETAEECPRSEIIDRIGMVRQRHPDRELKLFNREGRGIVLDDCPTLPDNCVCLCHDDTGRFPAHTAEEEL